MAFDPKYLAPTVYEAYKQGPIAWIFVVRTAVAVGYKNINTLTDIAFYIHHPELKGKSIETDDTELISQWKGFRKLIKTMLPSLCKPTVKLTSGFKDSPFTYGSDTNVETTWKIEEGET